MWGFKNKLILTLNWFSLILYNNKTELINKTKWNRKKSAKLIDTPKNADAIRNKKMLLKFKVYWLFTSIFD